MKWHLHQKSCELGKLHTITCTKAVCDLDEEDLWSISIFVLFIVHSYSGCAYYWLLYSMSSNLIYRLCIHLWSLLSSDVADVSVCPPVALDSGVGLLCRLFELWGRAAAGILTLTEWLLGEDEGNDKAVADDASSLVSIRRGTMLHKSKVRICVCGLRFISKIYIVTLCYKKITNRIQK